VRKDGTLPFLRPDGKSQVTIEYQYGKPVRVDTIVVSAQHDPNTGQDDIHDGIMEHVIKPIIAPELIDKRTRYFINPTGRFVVGGPMGDAGLTGRKIIVDTYGGMAPHGGGCFSGKDPTKVDRSAGIADRVELQLAYAIGVARPVSMNVECFGTNHISQEKVEALVEDNFDLRPGAIIRDLNLRRPIYRPTASYGHFGRTDIDAPWENTDKAETLRRQAGL